MANLTGETMAATLKSACGYETPTNSRAQGDHHEIVDSSPRSHTPLGHRGTGGVIVEENRGFEAHTEQSGEGNLEQTGQVGCRSKRAITSHQSGETHPNGLSPTKFVHHGNDGVDQGVSTLGRGNLDLTDYRSGGIYGYTQAFCAPDIDADALRHDSARTASSLRVLSIRTSARRFTKPGRGTTNSIDRS
jgi:hypothetical protein